MLHRCRENSVLTPVVLATVEPRHAPLGGMALIRQCVLTTSGGERSTFNRIRRVIKLTDLGNRDGKLDLRPLPSGILRHEYEEFPNTIYDVNARLEIVLSRQRGNRRDLVAPICMSLRPGTMNTHLQRLCHPRSPLSKCEGQSRSQGTSISSSKLLRSRHPRESSKTSRRCRSLLQSVELRNLHWGLLPDHMLLRLVVPVALNLFHARHRLFVI